MKNDQYLVMAVESGKMDCYAECDSLEEAEFAAQEVVNDASIDSVAIYMLQKVGRRVATVAWDTPQEYPGQAKTNGTAEPPRPAYQGANKRWSDDEIVYLKEAKDMGMSFAGIAKKLGRSQHAVELKYSRV